MTAKKIRSLCWPISNTDKINQIQVRVNAVYVDDESMEYSSGVQRLSLYFVVHNEFVYEMGHRFVGSIPGSETFVHSDTLCALDLGIDG